MEEQKRSEYVEAPRIQEQDEWALEWINVTRLQPIVEAFDDDASEVRLLSELPLEFPTSPVLVELLLELLVHRHVTQR